MAATLSSASASRARAGIVKGDAELAERRVAVLLHRVRLAGGAVQLGGDPHEVRVDGADGRLLLAIDGGDLGRVPRALGGEPIDLERLRRPHRPVSQQVSFPK